MSPRKIHRRTKAGHAAETTPRHLWLAVLGLVAVARREAPDAVANAAGEAEKLRRGVVRAAGDARDLARGIAITLQEAMAARFASRTATRKAARNPRKAARPASRRSAAGRRQASVRIARKGRG